MTGPSEGQIREALSKVRDPDSGEDIISRNMVSGLVIRDGNIGFAIEVDPQRGPHLEPLRKAAEQAVAAVRGVLSVTAVLTAQREASSRQTAGSAPAARR